MMRSTILLLFALTVSAFGQAFPGSAPYQAAFLKPVAAGGGGGGGNSFSDDFNRSGESPIVGNWETGLGSHNNANLIANAVEGAGGNWVARVKTSVATFAASTQWAQTTIVSGSENFAGPVVLCDGSGNGYAAAYVGGSACKIYEFTSGGSFTQIGADISGSFSAGDTIKLQSNGSGALELFKNGVSIGTRTDASSPLSSGQPGIWGGDSLKVDGFSCAD
jgi:hypothetical protein